MPPVEPRPVKPATPLPSSVPSSVPSESSLCVCASLAARAASSADSVAYLGFACAAWAASCAACDPLALQACAARLWPAGGALLPHPASTRQPKATGTSQREVVTL